MQARSFLVRALRRSLVPISRRGLSTSSRPLRTPAVVGLSAVASGILGFGLAQSLAGPPPATVETTLDASNQYGNAKDFSNVLAELGEHLEPKQISINSAVLMDYGGSNFHHHPAKPHRAVVTPKSTEEVVLIVNTCRKHRIPMVPYAGGTSLEGHTSGVRALFTRPLAPVLSHSCTIA